MNHLTRGGLVALFAPLASLVVAPAGATQPPGAAAAADPTISGTITAEDVDLNALSESVVVEAWAFEGDDWVVAGRSARGPTARTPSPCVAPSPRCG